MQVVPKWYHLKTLLLVKFLYKYWHSVWKSPRLNRRVVDMWKSIPHGFCLLFTIKQISKCRSIAGIDSISLRLNIFTHYFWAKFAAKIQDVNFCHFRKIRDKNWIDFWGVDSNQWDIFWVIFKHCENIVGMVIRTCIHHYFSS